MANQAHKTNLSTEQETSILDKHFDNFVHASETANISLDFLVPFLIDKDEDLILEAIEHLRDYAKRIPHTSFLAERLRMESKDMYPVKHAHISEIKH